MSVFRPLGRLMVRDDVDDALPVDHSFRHECMPFYQLTQNTCHTTTLPKSIRARQSATSAVGNLRRLSDSSSSSSSSSTSIHGLLTKDDIRSVLSGCQAVCFDVDSTVITEEGIDQLAAFKGVGAAVAELTRKAMGGQVLFQDALASRLSLIQPSRSDIDQFLRQHPPQLTKGVEQLIDLLHQRGKVVYLVSGGFRQMIEPVADSLRIPIHRIYANNLLFSNTAEGSFEGFDTNELTSRDGGKPAVLNRLIALYGYESIVMIGDGVTDMQARPPAKLFIGFGGVIEREAVKKGADWFVTDFQDIVDALGGDGTAEGDRKRE